MKPSDSKLNSPGTLRRVGGLSLTAQTREALIDFVLGGQFEDGMLPAEKDLVEMLGVSRTTVRAAMQSLQDAGVIVRTRGRGTHVRRHATPSMLALQRLVGFESMLRELGHEPSVESRVTRSDSVPESMLLRTECMAESGSDSWYCVEKVFSSDGDPAILMNHYFPESYLSEGTDLSGDFPDWFEFGRRFGRVQVDHAVVEIEAVRADNKIASCLRVPANAPMIVLHETHYSRDDEPLGYSYIAINQEILTLQVIRNE